jgi:hypothetical protein
METDEIVAEAPDLDHLLPAVRQTALLPASERMQRVRAVGRLLGDLPASLQRRMPRMAWGSLHPQRLPYALHRMCRRSPAAWE